MPPETQGARKRMPPPDLSPTITEFTLSSGVGGEPLGITVGPDGAIWFTETDDKANESDG